MDQFDLTDELKKLKEVKSANMAISSLVRSRLDETYASLPDRAATRKNKPKSRLRRITSVTSAAVILGTTLFASGFVSPVMANSIKSIPLIGSLFSSIEADIGLRNAGDLGLASPVNNKVFYKDVKLEVTETVFDGSRAAFLLRMTAPNLRDGKYDNGKRIVNLNNAIDNVFFSVDGKRQGAPGSILKGGFFTGAGEANPNMLIFEEVLDTSDARSVPDSFNAEVTLVLDGIDHEFKLDVPFRKSTDHIVNRHPDAAVTKDELTFSVTALQATPLTTRIYSSVALDKVTALNLNEENRLRRIGIAVFDDQGRQLPRLNGDGVYEGNRLNFDNRYATTPGKIDYLVLKPFVIKDDFTENVHEDQYIKGLEMKIDMHAAN
ncbi:DUF4179 domain-containing protein [Paenibacillus chitinolyticus]|uniref:DUF4179 domain-containing protein n=1 Tax=Paenibacillus chitinolyticus TaxID=79263 RepID=UPI002DB71E3B|nr:DUF4179 domain-containing protein [Paenibacillus chitinolyticus]MEC0244302.1 DUF4179 domain-containing protein [Paenibacillus chitinolyticus]